MASRRILNWSLFSLFGFTLFLASCAGSEQTAKDEEMKKQPEQTESVTDAQKERVVQVNFDRIRPSMSDLYANLNNELPAEFIPKDDKGDPIESNVGYRIQLMSSQSRKEAEEAMTKFNNWVFEQSDVSYKAETYIIFKQPYYRVHVGDFKSRNVAAAYNEKVKKLFSEAWIVRDNIELNKVPNLGEN